MPSPTSPKPPARVRDQGHDLRAVIRNVAIGVIIAALAVVAGVAATRSPALAAGIESGSAVLVALLTFIMVVRHPRI